MNVIPEDPRDVIPTEHPAQACQGQKAIDFDVAKIKEHYRHAREKHPYFCDIITCLSKDGADTHLDIYRATLAAELNANAVEASTLLLCEYQEAIQAYMKGDTAAAIEECYDAIAVLLRVIDVLEGRQPLGDPEKGGAK